MRNAVAPRAGRSRSARLSAGLGLRLPHLAEVATDGPPCPWLEIHPENFLANPHARELLFGIAEDCPISVHTVGISIGSADGVDREHVDRIHRLVTDLDPFLVSGHLAWSTHGGHYLNDLLPIPYDEESLQLVASQLHEVQDVIGRPYLVENPASYVGIGTSTLTEVQFLAELVSKTGCRLLCDVSNVFVSGSNMGFDPYEYIDAFPADAVDEIHLGGFTPEPDEALLAGEVLIDTHAGPIAEPVWALYSHALRRFGPRPTLIEWDNAIPDLATLTREAERANQVAMECDPEVKANAAAG
jgi:uncharacterized protein (UPF0276 family)